MSTNIINFNDNLNGNFYNRDKKIFNIDDIDIDSKKEIYGKYNSFKYFIGYNVNIFIRPLYLFIPQTTSYFNKFDENKITMSLIIKDTQRFKNTIKYRKKIEKLMKIDFNTKTTYGDDDKYVKTKKTYKDSITTNFYNKNGSEKIPEEKVPHKCLSIIILDSIIYAYEKYYPHIF